MLPKALREHPRRNAIIVLAVAAVGLAVAIVLFWSEGESGSTAAFCESARTGENPIDVFDQYDPTNVDTARVQLQRGVERLKQLEHAAPGEIRDDVQVLVAAAEQLVTVLDPAAKDKTAPDASAFDRVEAASGNVVRFAADNCGLQLDSAASTSQVTLSPQTVTSPP